MDKKRIIVIILFIVFCFVFGYIIYRMFFASSRVGTGLTDGRGVSDGAFPDSVTGDIDDGFPSQDGLPVADDSDGIDDFFLPSDFPDVRQVTSDPVIGSTVDSSGSLKFYNETDGRFYKVDRSGNSVPLTDDVFFNVKEVTWSPTKNESIIEYPDGANIYYNFDTKKQVTLPKHWEDFSFSNGTDKIAAKSVALSPENRWLITSNPDGNEVELIEALGNNQDKVDVDWSPNRQIVAVARTGEAISANRQNVHLVGLHGENFRSLTVEGRGFESIWSPKGKTLLYSVYSSRNNFNPELWIANAEGTTVGTGRKNLAINTWSDKCAFSGERTLYCAVPSELQRGSGFNRNIANNTPDNFYKIDVNTGIRNQLDVDAFHVVKSMFIGEDGKTLFFTDIVQPGLFSLPL